MDLPPTLSHKPEAINKSVAIGESEIKIEAFTALFCEASLFDWEGDLRLRTEPKREDKKNIKI